MMRARANHRPTVNSHGHKPAVSRLLGVYPQKQRGLFMQRVKVFGGRISWSQWRRIAELAGAHCGGFPLHITTRQDVELHNVILDDIPVIQQGLAEVGLTTFGAGGDSIRNMTVCSACDFCSGGFDLLPLAQVARQHIDTHAAIFSLPRKFKISFSGCDQACGKPWLNDLGFIAQSDGLLTVIGVGSLGAKPALGIKLYEDLPSKDILPLCFAAIEFFGQCGDRENRRLARFRHIRERLGHRAFRKELDVRFRRQRARKCWPDISPTPSSTDIELLWRLRLPNGNMTANDALQLADVGEAKGAILRINLEHGLELYGREGIEMPDNLAMLAKNPTIVACPGATTCTRGLVDCWATAEKIREAIASGQRPEARIHISGCRNNCAHSAVADIGLVGMRRMRDGKSTACYRLFRGGGNGTRDQLAKPSEIVRDKDVPGVIKDSLMS